MDRTCNKNFLRIIEATMLLILRIRKKQLLSETHNEERVFGEYDTHREY